jgi:hypothetical protein
MADDYEAELARITKSGPHEIDSERRELNRVVLAELTDIVPFNDIHKVSDCDLIYRFLIAHRWEPAAAMAALREYMAWRDEMKLNTLLWEDLPAAVLPLLPKFMGTDLDGNPVFYDRPDPKETGLIMVEVPRETILRAHFVMMEQGRRLCKIMGVDRVSCILDMTKLNMAIVTNPSAVGLLKESSKLDQKYFPENMRSIMICNGGWTFSILWKVMRPLLDVRVQNKVKLIASGDKRAADMEQYVDLAQVPRTFGGSADEITGHGFPMLDEVKSTPIGTPPITFSDML